MVRLALLMSVAMLAGCSTTGWRSQKIDGSSQPAFERSVALLQERLPSRRRADFETSLAVIWLRDATVGAGDLDSDGDVEVDEARALMDAADRALTAIRRGIFVAELEERGDSVDRYVKRLGGLRYEEVIELADLTSGGVFIEAARGQQKGARCRRWHRAPPPIKSPVMSRYCRRH